MMRYQRREVALAACFSALAGYVDALGFITLGGFFVSFMTGNTTRLGIELASGNPGGIALAGSVIVLFVCGVVLGSLVGHFAGRDRPPAVLGVVTLLLVLAALMQTTGHTLPAVGLLAVAMGAENAVFQRDGEVTIGLTYMTGTLVKLGQRIAAATLGGPKRAFLRHFLLWLGLMGGAFVGAFVHSRIGLAAIWVAAAAALALTFAALIFLREG
ncbi:YoaK family protein [Bosea sp. BH3]|uniref:YoaK family protein n=1 Tax=Bosea sp. BH3 TaxID=2871701 RepID=UPI0021CB0259|nr:YoaK family protein [Bosea sp. BH3]